MHSHASSLTRPVARIYRAPERVPEVEGPSIFLAGTTRGRDWQSAIMERIAHLDITIFNPRRAGDWDSSRTMTQDQVQWVQEQQERCDVAVIYMDRSPGSPVSVGELQRLSRDKKAVGLCYPGKSRENKVVETVCERLDIPLVETLDELVEMAVRRLQVLLEQTT